MKRILVLAFAFISTSFFSHASAIEFGPIGMGGNGCRQGLNANVRILGGLGHVLAEFRDLKASSTTARRLSRVNCSMALPVKVPPGKKFVVMSAVVRGHKSIKNGTQGAITSEIFIPGGRSIRKQLLLRPGGSNAFGIEFSGPRIEGACGQDLTLRQNTSVLLRQNGLWGSQASVTYSLIQVRLVNCR